MLDVSHIPSSDQTTQVFYTTGNNSWQTWRKPRGAKFVHVFCVGAGGGGGGGRGQNTTRTGGGGGASGGITSVFLPLFFLPDILYVLPGIGGQGGAGGSNSAGSAGTAGGTSYVSIYPSTGSAVVVCLASGGNAGGGGSTSATRGASSTAPTTNITNQIGLGIYQTYGTVAGGTNAELSFTALNTNLVMGAPGSGTAVGGSVTGSTFLLTQNVIGGATSSASSSAAGAGGSGYGIMRPFCGTAGAGGGAHIGTIGANGIGGRGGNGWYGCGGGGGGCSIVTGGRGGNGGDGIIMITTIF